jgi:hypothetical protein
VLLLRSFQSVHPVLKTLVQVGDVDSLVLELSSEGRKLITLDGNFTFEALFVLLKALDLFSQLGQESLLGLDLRRGGLVVVDLPLQLSLPIL